MAEDFALKNGTISITSGTKVVTGTGTTFAGTNLAESILYAVPVDAAMFPVGVVATTEDGEYDNLELTLVDNYNGTTLEDSPYILVFGPAIANGAEQAAVFARVVAQLTRGGIVYDAADDPDPALILNNSLKIDTENLQIIFLKDGVPTVVGIMTDESGFLNAPRFVTDGTQQTPIVAKYEDDGADVGPILDVERVSASAAASDSLGRHNFSGRNSAGEKIDYANITAQIVDPTDGSEDGQLYLQGMIGGVLTTVATFGANFTVSRPLVSANGTGSLPGLAIGSASHGFSFLGGNTIGFSFGGSLATRWLTGGSGFPSEVRGHTTTVQVPGPFTPETQYHANTTSGSSFMMARWSANNGGPAVFFSKSRGAIGTPTVVQSGDTLGSIEFYGADGTDFAKGAAIIATVDGTPGSDDMPTRLEFLTSADGSQSPTSNLRLNSAGAAFFPLIGTTGSAANAFLNSGSSPANSLLRSTSSLAFKTGIEPLEENRAKDFLSRVEPIWYRSLAPADRFDDDSLKSFYSFGAEPLAEIDPRLVTWGYPDEAWEDIEVQSPPTEVRRTTPKKGARPQPDGTYAQRDLVEDVVVEPGQKRIERRLKEGAQKVPDGVNDRAVIAMLVNIVKRQEERIAALEAAASH